MLDLDELLYWGGTTCCVFYNVLIAVIAYGWWKMEDTI